eukprot:scpid37583/ scgid16290/ 
MARVPQGFDPGDIIHPRICGNDLSMTDFQLRMRETIKLGRGAKHVHTGRLQLADAVDQHRMRQCEPPLPSAPSAYVWPASRCDKSQEQAKVAVVHQHTLHLEARH